MILRFLVLLIPLVGIIFIRSENEKIKFYNFQKFFSIVFIIILGSSAAITPFSISATYWPEAYADTNMTESLGPEINNSTLPSEELFIPPEDDVIVSTPPATNATDVTVTNATDITTNATDVTVTNATDITTNATDVTVTNATDITTNATDVTVTNATDITTNATDVTVTNATDITTNATDVTVTNATDITTNATDVTVTNATDITTNATDVSVIITKSRLTTSVSLSETIEINSAANYSDRKTKIY